MPAILLNAACWSDLRLMNQLKTKRAKLNNLVLMSAFIQLPVAFSWILITCKAKLFMFTIITVKEKCVDIIDQSLSPRPTYLHTYDHSLDYATKSFLMNYMSSVRFLVIGLPTAPIRRPFLTHPA